MGRSVGFILLIAAVGAGASLHTKEASPVSYIASSPSSVIDVVGIRNDLMAIAMPNVAVLWCTRRTPPLMNCAGMATRTSHHPEGVQAVTIASPIDFVPVA